MLYLPMGNYASVAQNSAFLVHCEYVSCTEAALKTGLASTTAKDLYACAGALEVERAERGELPLSYELG
jgi:hypothetical protein